MQAFKLVRVLEMALPICSYECYMEYDMAIGIDIVLWVVSMYGYRTCKGFLRLLGDTAVELYRICFCLGVSLARPPDELSGTVFVAVFGASLIIIL